MRYLFEEYAFDTDRRELHRGADVVSVAPQVFDLLDYLIRNRERVVSKDDLINAIWNGRSRVRCGAYDAAECRSERDRRYRRGTAPHQNTCRARASVSSDRAGSAGVRRRAVADNPLEPPKPALTLPDKPSIAVLPFTNLSSDLEQEYFADGMVDEITTALVAVQICYSSSRAIRVLLTRAEPSISSRSGANSAFATCWKAVCARRPEKSASPAN